MFAPHPCGKFITQLEELNVCVCARVRQLYCPTQDVCTLHYVTVNGVQKCSIICQHISACPSNYVKVEDKVVPIL